MSETQSPSCDKQVQLEKPLYNLLSRMSQIIQRRVEEIFPGLKERLVGVLCRKNCNISFINTVADGMGCKLDIVRIRRFADAFDFSATNLLYSLCVKLIYIHAITCTYFSWIIQNLKLAVK